MNGDIFVQCMIRSKAKKKLTRQNSKQQTVDERKQQKATTAKQYVELRLNIFIVAVVALIAQVVSSFYGENIIVGVVVGENGNGNWQNG